MQRLFKSNHNLSNIRYKSRYSSHLISSSYTPHNGHSCGVVMPMNNSCCCCSFSSTVTTKATTISNNHRERLQRRSNQNSKENEQRRRIENEFQKEYDLLVESGQSPDGSFDESRFKRAQELLKQFVKLINNKLTAQRAFVYQFNLDCLIYFQLKREGVTLHAQDLLAHTNRLLESEHAMRKLIDHHLWFWRFTDFHLTRGLCFMSLKQLENALDSFNFLVDKKLKPILQHPQVKEGNEEDEEKRLLNTYYKTALKNRFSVLLELNKLDRALGDISKYHEMYHDDESTYLLAHTHELLGQYNEAITVAKKLLLGQVDKEWRTKGTVLLTSVIGKCYKEDKPGAQENALKMCDELIDYYPDAFDLYLTRSMLNYHRNDIDKALADSEEYLKRGGSPLLIYEIRYNCMIKAQKYEQILAETDDLLTNMGKYTKGLEESTVESLKKNLTEGRANIEQLLNDRSKS